MLCCIDCNKKNVVYEQEKYNYFSTEEKKSKHFFGLQRVKHKTGKVNQHTQHSKHSGNVKMPLLFLPGLNEQILHFSLTSLHHFD